MALRPSPMRSGTRLEVIFMLSSSVTARMMMRRRAVPRIWSMARLRVLTWVMGRWMKGNKKKRRRRGIRGGGKEEKGYLSDWKAGVRCKDAHGEATVVGQVLGGLKGIISRPMMVSATWTASATLMRSAYSPQSTRAARKAPRYWPAMYTGIWGEGGSRTPAEGGQ